MARVYPYRWNVLHADGMGCYYAVEIFDETAKLSFSNQETLEGLAGKIKSVLTGKHWFIRAPLPDILVPFGEAESLFREEFETFKQYLRKTS